MMKQPSLGLKLTELRKAKGLTQEELVIRCNVSVRTIQRIEAGEVTPRSYTVRSMLGAMGYPFELVFDPTSHIVDDVSGELAESPGVNTGGVQEQSADPVYGAPHSNIAAETATSSQGRFLTLACISGIVYILTGSVEGIADVYRMPEGELLFGAFGYVSIKIVASDR